MDSTYETDILYFTEELPTALHYVRLARGKSIREVGAETGIPFQTVARIERRGSNNVATIRALNRWLAAGELVV